MVTILTEEELKAVWKITTPTEEKIFQRMLNQKLPKKNCPRYIEPKHIIRIGSVKKFYFDPEKGWPAIKTKA